MLNEILEGVDEKQISNFINKLIEIKKNGKKIFVIAAGRANLIAKSFAMRLMQIGFNSYVVYETNTPACCEGDLLIAVSGSGNTMTVLQIVDEAIQFGAEVLAISKNENSTLISKVNDYIIIPTGRRSEKIHTNGSEFEQSLFILLDCIGVEIIEKLGYTNGINEIDKFIKQLHANLQ